MAKQKKILIKAVEVDEPQSRDEQLLRGIIDNESVDLGDPQSRNEKILMAILGEDVTPEPPQSRIEQLLLELKAKIEAMGTTEELTVTANGDYSEQGKNYSPVHVNVPNTYAAGDEGKVVSIKRAFSAFVI